MTRWPGKGANPDENSADFAALLHEHHHWLQHVGTSAGLFGSVLLELQASAIAVNVPLDALRASDLPLLHHEDRYASPLLLWERLEATRRLYFGCRPADLNVLIGDGRAPLWDELAPLLDPVIELVLADASDMATFLAVRHHPDLQVKVGTAVIREAGWSVGARHLMEGAARQSEVFHLLAEALDEFHKTTAPPEEFSFALSPRYTGEYGLAWQQYFDTVGVWTKAAEIGFAFACDLALNCLSPPLYAFPPHNPGTYFARVINKLSSFRFDREMNPFDPRQVRALLDELTEHVGEDLAIPMQFKRDMTNRFFGHLHPDEVAQHLFTISGQGHMAAPAGVSPRLRYQFALNAHAERLRAHAPETFVVPAASHLDDLDAFRELFRQIRPPLLSYGEGGIFPSRQMPGWLDFFLAAGVHMELLRAVVMHDVSGIAARLAPYVRSERGREHGLSVIGKVLRGTFRDGPAGEEIWRHVVAAAERAPAMTGPGDG
jgi:hypothetical protein